MRLCSAAVLTILGLAAQAAAQTYSTVAFAGIGTWDGDGHPVSQSVLNYPTGLAVGPDGSIYIRDSGRIRRVTPDGIINTVAGTLTTNVDTGDGGPATSAGIGSQAMNVAVDPAGNIFLDEVTVDIAGNSSALIRKVQASDQTIQLFAGNGQVPGDAGLVPGDGGPALNAPLGFPFAMATTPQGDLIITDTNRILEITPEGLISTLAGGGTVKTTPYNISNQTALGANLYGPGGVATDAEGTIFFTEIAGEAVFQLAGTEMVRIAGSGDRLVNSATTPLLLNINYPNQLAADAQGDIYIGDSSVATTSNAPRTGTLLYTRIEEVPVPGSSISVLAGANSGYEDRAGDLGIKDVLPRQLNGLAVDSKGVVYYPDDNQSIVLSITNGVLGTFAGGYQVPYSGDGGPATSAQFYYPYAVIFDQQGNAYISDAGHDRVLKVNTNGVISTFAGAGSFGFSGDGASALEAEFDTPTALAFDTAGNLYIADSGNQRIREVLLKDGTIQTIVGDGQQGAQAASVPAAQAAIDYISSMLFDPSGNLIFTDANQCSVRKWNPTTNVVTLIAGTGRCQSSPDGALANNATVGAITGAVLASDGTLYIADNSSNSIRSVNSAGILGTVASVESPDGLAMDASGNFYTGSENYLVVIPANGRAQTIAGSSVIGYNGDNKPALQAALYTPQNPILDSSGNIFFVDRDRVRELIPPPQVNSVVNAASFVSGSVAPGELVTVFGTGIGPSSLIGLELASNGTVSNNLAMTQALFDGTAAPMVYADRLQTSFLVPYEVAGKSSTQFTIAFNGVASNAVTLDVAPAAPGIFTAAGGKGQGAILNQDGSSNSATNPAAIGSVVVLYATGAGQTNPPGQDGVIANGTAPKPVLPVTVEIGGMPAVVQYAGGASGLVSGVIQVNAVVPKGTSTGSAVPVTIMVGGAASQSGVTLAVK
jgi:uncharacterized protein (TIGR03437 family)